MSATCAAKLCAGRPERHRVDRRFGRRAPRRSVGLSRSSPGRRRVAAHRRL